MGAGRSLRLAAVWVAAAAAPGAASAAPPAATATAAPGDTAAPTRDARRQAALSRWVASLPEGARRTTFGRLVAQVGLAQLGTPYGHGIWDEPPPEEGVGGPWAAPAPAPAPGGDGERPDALVGSGDAALAHRHAFDCVTFVEATLALARCLRLTRAELSCVAGELAGLRFAGGAPGVQGQRLHYFEAWLADNAARGNLRLFTERLGPTWVQAPFFFISAHPALFPQLLGPWARAAIARQEAELGARRWPMVGREDVAGAVAHLEAGDIVAIVGRRPGLLVTHLGLVFEGADGARHLLHASSAHRRVVLTPDGIADYVARRGERRGIVVARPVAPGRQSQRPGDDAPPGAL